MTLMKMIGTAAGAIALAASGACAATVLGDEFTVTSTLFDGELTGTAGSGDADFEGNDVSDEASGVNVAVKFTDANSFDFRFFTSSDAPLQDFSFTLSGLDFNEGGTPVDIANFLFASTNLPEFQLPEEEEDPNTGELILIPREPDAIDVVGPITSFTADSVTFSFSLFGYQVAGDGVRFSFDIVAGDEVPNPQVVPLPAGLLLLGSALVPLGLARRRRRG